MSIRRFDFPYKDISSVSGFISTPIDGLLDDCAFIVLPPGDVGTVFEDRDNQLAITNNSNPFGYDFYSPISEWPIVNAGIYGDGAGNVMYYVSGTGWTPLPTFTTIPRSSIYLVKAGETVFIPSGINLLWYHDLTNNGTIINHGRMASV